MSNIDYSLRFAKDEENSRILRENLLSAKFCVDSRMQRDPARCEEFLIKTLGFLDDHSRIEELPAESFVLYALDKTEADDDYLSFVVCDPARYTSLREIGRYFDQTPPVRIPRIWFNQEGHFFTNGTDYWSFLSGNVSFLIGVCQGADYDDYENVRFLLPDEGFLSALGRVVSVGKLRPVDSSLMELYLSDLLYTYASHMNCLIRSNGLGGEKVYHIFSKNYLRVGYIDSLRYIREFFEKDGIGTKIRSWKAESSRTVIDMELSWRLTPCLERAGYKPGPARARGRLAQRRLGRRLQGLGVGSSAARRRDAGDWGGFPAGGISPCSLGWPTADELALSPDGPTTQRPGGAHACVQVPSLPTISAREGSAGS